MPTRRQFSRQLTFLAAAVVAAPSVFRSRAGTLPGDETVLKRTFEYARTKELAKLPVGGVVAALGRWYLGAPYVAHSLEASGPEQLVVNLRAFDCTTFIENMLALARCVKLGKESMAEFRFQLQLIRYRGGVLDGYPSRLHYFTDWIADNDAKNVVDDVTQTLGGVPRRNPVTFMSGHTESYAQLADPASLAAIKEAEARLTAMQRWYLPKKEVPKILPSLRDGDLIGITTSVEGLDVAHTGMVAVEGGVARFLHAPLSVGKVEIAGGSLADYLERHRTHDGIVVARPRDV